MLINHKGENMNSYLMLGQYTEKGISEIDETQDRIKRFKDSCQKEGVKVTAYFMLMGRYDVACILEAPNPEVVAKIALLLGKVGNVRTETLPAFNDREQIELVGQLNR
jgi:uncharacterized protein with GYD domain